MICCLARHGKDDDTVRGGWSRSGLSCEGVGQAKALSAAVQREGLCIQHIYSSDLHRAMQTAGIVACELQLPITAMAGFREVNNGELAGMKNELAAKKYPGLYWNTLDWEQRYPGGESPKAFYQRVCEAWDTFQKRIIAQGENVLLVTHSGVMHVILSIVNGVAYSNRETQRKIRNGEWIILAYRDGLWKEAEWRNDSVDIL